MTEPYLDLQLTEESMNHLWDIINTPAVTTLKVNPYASGKDARSNLAGNISKSVYIEDKNNWLFENVLKELAEHIHFSNWNNYYEVMISKSKPPPIFELKEIWVNYQKQHEFNPPHNHAGDFSFVVFMKIPTHWKEQHALPFSVDATLPSASDFQFVWTTKDSEVCTTTNFQLSSEDEGRMLFFPAYLRHQVYPFYGCEEERVTISGNICLPPIRVSASRDGIYEEKKQNLKLLEKSVKLIKEELKHMKKSG